MTIRGSQFILRPFRKGDEESQIRNINNPKIAQNTRIPYPYTMRDAKAWIKKNLNEAKKKSPSMICFAIEIGGEVAGSVGLHHIETNHKAELGYWLAEKYWNRGIMTEAVKLVTTFALTKLKLYRIYSSARLSNHASQRVLEKAGFRFEGIQRKGLKKGNEFIDLRTYAKVK